MSVLAGEEWGFFAVPGEEGNNRGFLLFYSFYELEGPSWQGLSDSCPCPRTTIKLR